MINIWDLLVIKPLTFIINAIYSVVPNYGWTIILFTLAVKLILIPLNIKSQRAMKKQQKIQPVIAELQKKYANDKEKLQMEMMKIYRENNVSMTGGCMPLLIQMPILIGLYRVIMNMANDATMNFNFYSMDLSKVPSMAVNAITKGDFSNIGTIMLILIPALAIFTSWLSMKVTQLKQPKNNGQDQAAQMTSSMNLMMPIMTGFFTLTLPAGMGLYWIASNVFQILQHIALDKILEKEEDMTDVKLPEPNRKHSKKRKK